MNVYPGTYGSFLAVTPSDTTSVSCRAVYVGGAGNISINPGLSGGTTVVITTPVPGSIVSLELNQGRIMAATTATGLVALA